ncbi:hypothetical protein PS15p_209962 [Mucor circinelloides]
MQLSFSSHKSGFFLGFWIFRSLSAYFFAVQHLIHLENKTGIVYDLECHFPQKSISM